MKNKFLITTVITTTLLYSVSFAQLVHHPSTLEYRMVTDNVKKYRNCFISNLGYHKLDGNYEKATEQQLGVIGNDFIEPMKIGMAPAEDLGVTNTWFPIDGFKRTLIGKHIAISIHSNHNSEYKDDDWNIRLRTPMSNPLIVENKEKLENENKRKYPINIITGEIDLKHINKPHLMKYSNNAPKAYIDQVGMYGPWVFDRGARWIVEKVFSHGSFVEIHPMEQLWWTEKQGRTKRIYHLNFANDNKGSFNDASDFDPDWSTHFPWQTNPMVFTYYIPFNIPIKGKKVEYKLTSHSKYNLTQKYTDGLEHNLIYKGKKILTISEPDGDIVKIDFINTGIDPVAILGNIKDTLIKGFIKIETRIGVTNDIAGNLFLKLTEENPNLVPDPYQDGPLLQAAPAIPSRTYKITLQNIKCTGLDDDSDDEDLFGFIGVRAETNTFYPLEANHLPDNSLTPLLWSRLDGNCLNIKKGQSIGINNSFLYKLPTTGSSITLYADLDEDDGNDDGNETVPDTDDWYNLVDGNNDDDRLQAIPNDTEGGGANPEGVVYKPIPLNSLVLNRPETRKMYFGSGGTKIEVFFKIELIAETKAVYGQVILQRAD